MTEIFIGETNNEQIKGLINNMWRVFFCYTIQLITIKLCTKFQNPNLSSCLEIFEHNTFTQLLYTLTTQNLKTLAPIGDEKSATEIFVGKKKNEQIKGLISNMWLFFCNTIQLITIKLSIKFQNHKSSRC